MGEIIKIIFKYLKRFVLGGFLLYAYNIYCIRCPEVMTYVRAKEYLSDRLPSQIGETSG